MSNVISPQVENGHIDIANEIAEALMKINLSAYQSRVLWVIWRKTYGWHKKEDYISISQIVEMTGIVKTHVNRTLKELVLKNIIYRENKLTRFNKIYTEWIKLPIQVTIGKLPIQATELPIQVTNVTNSGNLGVLKLDPIKDNTKETIKRNSSKESTLLSLFEKIESKFTPEQLIHKKDFLERWTEKKPNGKKERWQMEKTFDVNLRFHTWLRNEEKWYGKKKQSQPDVSAVFKQWRKKNADKEKL